MYLRLGEDRKRLKPWAIKVGVALGGTVDAGGRVHCVSRHPKLHPSSRWLGNIVPPCRDAASAYVVFRGCPHPTFEAGITTDILQHKCLMVGRPVRGFVCHLCGLEFVDGKHKVTAPGEWTHPHSLEMIGGNVFPGVLFEGRRDAGIFNGLGYAYDYLVEMKPDDVVRTYIGRRDRLNEKDLFWSWDPGAGLVCIGLKERLSMYTK